MVISREFRAYRSETKASPTSIVTGMEKAKKPVKIRDKTVVNNLPAAEHAIELALNKAIRGPPTQRNFGISTAT
jgi:hypothetical protein